MTSPDRRLLNAALRNNFPLFIQRVFQTVSPGDVYLPNWHILAIAHHLELVRRRQILRLLITMPPRHMKSICASVAFPAFLLGHDPTLQILCASYAYGLAKKFSNDTRTVMKARWYGEAFAGTRISPNRDTEMEFQTTAMGGRLSTSVDGGSTGRGGNFLIIDDPMKPSEAMSDVQRGNTIEWYGATISTRLNQKNRDPIVVVMQRLHMDDLAGHLLELDPSWVHLNLPAIADYPQIIPIGDGRTHARAIGDVLHPERESREALEQQKIAMGSLAFSAQYQQAPVPPGGALVQRDWFRWYTRLPEKQSGDRIVLSWDTASKAALTNDYSVCTVWFVRKNDYYLMEVYRERLEYPELRRRAISLIDRYKPKTVLIEDAGTGTALIQDLQRDAKIRPIGIRPEKEKLIRLETQCAPIEAGHVLLPEEASWLGDFLTEILSFPNGKFDDQADSVSQFLEWVRIPRQRVHVGGWSPSTGSF